MQEKIRISENCSVGTYIFSSCEVLLNLCDKYLKDKNKTKNNEFYIAPIFQYAIEKNFRVEISKAQNVKVFGTPKELIKTFEISYDELLGENAWDLSN